MFFCAANQRCMLLIKPKAIVLSKSTKPAMSDVKYLGGTTGTFKSLCIRSYICISKRNSRKKSETDGCGQHVQLLPREKGPGHNVG